ncbi:hypothetical protein [uncultured Gilvimarinus sp.]|uniref:hypothetical protein n=1 Tax=uncultured Gilvimarinus sp. TaxID=1689143 RepID=UPI0030DB3C1F
MDWDLNMTVAPSRFTVKARYLVVLWLMSFVFVPGYSLFARLLNAQTASWYWYDLVYYSCLYGSLSILIAIQLFNSNVHFKGVFTKPASGEWWPSLLLTAVSFAFATAVFYGTFVPLSYLVPNFVQHWVIELPHLIYFTPDGYIPLWANVLSFVFIVVIPSCVEELIFRGILLHRWAYKYGTRLTQYFGRRLFLAQYTPTLWAPLYLVPLCAWFTLKAAAYGCRLFVMRLII